MLLAALVIAAIAALFDLQSRRIPNWLTYSALIVGLLVAFFSGGEQRLVLHVVGIGVAVPFLALFYLGLFGGGDVKLMAAVVALVGPFYGMNIAISSLLIGGLCAAIILLWQSRLWNTLVREVRMKTSDAREIDLVTDSFPFGVAIALATLGWYLYSIGSGP